MAEEQTRRFADRLLADAEELATQHGGSSAEGIRAAHEPAAKSEATA